MIVARHVTGKIMKLRAVVRYLLIALFFLIPYLQYNGRQAFLLDLDNRKFYFPGFVIWPQEFYYLLFLLLLIGLSLFLVTALLGRVFCGWICPQTIYVELYDAVGRLIFPSRFGKRSFKTTDRIIVHIVWILLSFAVVFHFVGYFVSPGVMIQGVLNEGIGVFTGNAWPYFLTVISLLFYADIAWFREQYCVYLCPYARFMSVMLDDDSVVIAYDKYRGEPRRQAKGSTATELVQTELIQHKEGEGDCTNCNMCTLVCPTGIDIREGLQVACINCGHCIDACTHEMEKFNKPSLVDFSSMNYFEKRIKTKFLRARTLIYSVLLAAIVITAGIIAWNRKPIHFWVYPDPKISSFYMNETTAQNYYKMDVGNITEQDRSFVIEVRPLNENSPVVKLNVMTAGSSAEDAIFVKGNDLHKSSLVIQGEIDPAKLSSGQRMVPVIFHVHDRDNPSVKIEKKASFVIPEK